MGYLYDVFISFNSRDAVLATEVYDKLRSQNLYVFFSDSELKEQPEAVFTTEINKAIENSRCFLLVASSKQHFMPLSSQNSSGSNWVENEIANFKICYMRRKADDPSGNGVMASLRTKEVALEELPLDFQRPNLAIEYDGTSACYEKLFACLRGKEPLVGASLARGGLADREKELNQLELGWGYAPSDDARHIKITQTYVSLPINTIISIYVRNGRVERISDNESLDNCIIEDSKYALFKRSIQRKIDQGIEYRFQDPQKRPKILSSVRSDGFKKNFWVLNAIDAIAVNQKCVVIGDPGSGKSTLLRFLSILLTKQYLSDENVLEHQTLSSEFYERKYLPLLIELSDIIPWLEKTYGEDAEECNLQMLAAYIYGELLGRQYKDPEEEIHSIIKERCIFLFDGLDEISPSAADKKAFHPLKKGSVASRKKIICSLIESIGTFSPKSKIVLSCRQRDYEQWNLKGMTKVYLQLMDEPIMRRLISNISNSYKVEADPDELLEQLKSMHIDEKLCRTPLFLSLITVMFLGEVHNLPDNKSVILEDSIILLLRRKQTNFTSDPSKLNALVTSREGLNDIIDALERIAYKIQAQSENGELSLTREELMGSIFAESFETTTPKDFLEFFQKCTGIIARRDEKYEFLHRHFQEFLCASYLSKLPLYESEKIIREGLLLSPAKWSEPCLLFAEIFLDRGRKNDLWEILYRLLYNAREAAQTGNATCWIIWYAASVVSIRKYTLLPRFDQNYDFRNNGTLDLLREAITELLQKNQPLPIMQRIECANTLGMIGDTREGVGLGLNERLPHHAWLPVGTTKQTFTMGATEYIQATVRGQKTDGKRLGNGTSFDREIPTQEIVISPFYLSKYQTTVKQFLSFINAEDGYCEERWWKWCNIAWEWFQQNVNESRVLDLKKAADFRMNYPVTNVNFLEAAAYCLWLSEQTGEHIRMPTEGEWEYAAKAWGQVFSWGDQFDPNMCNSSYSGIGDIVPVGVFLPSKGKDVPCDMNGNVWEWCQSIYPAWGSDEDSLSGYDEKKNFLNTQACYDLIEPIKVAVRGGSFLNPPALLRNTFRGRDWMEDAFYRQGFRVLKEITHHPSNIPGNMSCKLSGGSPVFKPGAGKTITAGDHVRITYKVYRDSGELLENKMLPEDAVEAEIGAGELNSQIEQYILEKNMSVAGTFELNIQVSPLGDGSEEQYRVLIYIQECK